MALSSLGLQFTYKQKGEQGGMEASSLGFCGSRVSSLSERGEKIIPLLFLKIDFKYNLLLIKVQSLNELNEQEGVVGIF